MVRNAYKHKIDIMLLILLNLMEILTNLHLLNLMKMNVSKRKGLNLVCIQLISRLNLKSFEE